MQSSNQALSVEPTARPRQSGFRAFVVLFSIITLHLSLLSPLQAQQPLLSPTATASLLTCGAGNEFYYTFGHSAIRITDSVNGVDVVYNYGTFNFGTPHFYWKFMRGRLDYCLSRTSMAGFVREYQYDGRSVFEQRLDLSSQEVNNLFVLLETNYLPEYRYYKYDFLRDNCATRVRDMVDAASGHSPLLYSYEDSHTYREYLHDAMRDTLEWWALGVDLLLGVPADHRCTANEAMFYPKELMRLYSIAQRNGRPFAPAVVKCVDDSRLPKHRSFPPLAAFSIALAVMAVLTVVERRRGWNLKWMDRILFTVAGVAGLFLCFLWFGSDHYCTKWNLNILWLSPLLVLIAIRLERSPLLALWFQMGLFALAALMCIFAWPQALNIALLPVILIFALRLYRAIADKHKVQ